MKLPVHHGQTRPRHALCLTHAVSKSPVPRAVDLTSSAAALLLAVLIASGQQIAYVPGRTVNRMAGIFRGEGKTDAEDARLIAETAPMRADLAMVTVPSTSASAANG